MLVFLSLCCIMLVWKAQIVLVKHKGGKEMKYRYKRFEVVIDFTDDEFETYCDMFDFADNEDDAFSQALTWGVGFEGGATVKEFIEEIIDGLYTLIVCQYEENGDNEVHGFLLKLLDKVEHNQYKVTEVQRCASGETCLVSI